MNYGEILLKTGVFPFLLDPSSAVALRIRRADTVIEVSGDAPDNILAFLKAVMTDVV